MLLMLLLLFGNAVSRAAEIELLNPEVAVDEAAAGSLVSARPVRVYIAELRRAAWMLTVNSRPSDWYHFSSSVLYCCLAISFCEVVNCCEKVT
jgi:hypothetical protein